MMGEALKATLGLATVLAPVLAKALIERHEQQQHTETAPAGNREDS